MNNNKTGNNRAYGSGFFKVNVAVLLLTALGCHPLQNLPDPLQAGWANQAVCEVLQENKQIRVLKCTFPPGVGHERHYHEAHFGYTLAGSRFRISDSKGTREVDVPTGYNYYNEGIDWHEVLNIGDSVAVFLIIEPR